MGYMNPFQIRQRDTVLTSTLTIYDLSNMGPGEDVVGKIYRGDIREEEEIELGQMTPVNSLLFVFF